MKILIKIALLFSAIAGSPFYLFAHSDFDPKNPKTILVTGGAGFIGSHINELLYSHGYQTIVLDNLSQGKKEAVVHGQLIVGDLSDETLLEELFSTYPIDAVMHFAASIHVEESVLCPLDYYENNVVNTLKLLRAMQRHNVPVFIFSSTAAIFGNLAEEYHGIASTTTPAHPVSPYGKSKNIVEEILPDLARAYNFRFCCLRYFNATGGDPAGIVKSENPERTNLIPIVLKKLLVEKSPITVFGTDYPTEDGSAIRDYIHVMDLGSAHIAAMEKLFAGGESCVYNLGNGRGYSVKEVIAAAVQVTGKQTAVIEGDRRLGDLAIVIADPSKAQEELGWQPQYPSVETMIEHYLNSSGLQKSLP